jgi:hypothetical protein
LACLEFGLLQALTSGALGRALLFGKMETKKIMKSVFLNPAWAARAAQWTPEKRKAVAAHLERIAQALYPTARCPSLCPLNPSRQIPRQRFLQ